MRILLTSDEHHHRWAAFAGPASLGRNTRFDEGLQVERWLEQTIPHDVRLRGGDLFHRTDVLDAVVATDVMHLLAETSTFQHILAGNHCSAAGGVRRTVEALQWVPGVQVYTDATMCPAIGGDERVAAAFVPYYGNTAATIAAVERMCRALPAHATTRVLVAHTSIAGARLGSEYVIPEELTAEHLRPDVFTHVFVGHCHEPQKLRANVWHIGSLMQRSFADVGAPRRALLLETETGVVTSIATPGPQFVVWRGDTLEAFQQWASCAGNYVKIVTPSSAIPADTWRAVAHECGARGVVVHYDTHDAPLPDVTAVQPLATTWAECLADYVQRSETALDRPRLLTTGHDLIMDVEGVSC